KATLTAQQVQLNKTGTANGAVTVSGTGNTRTVTISSTTGDGTLSISSPPGTAVDTAGNLASSSAVSDLGIIANTRPATTISAPSLRLTSTTPVTYTVRYFDEHFAGSSLDQGKIVLNRTGSADGTVSVSGSAKLYTVTISNITGNGTLGISILTGTAV